MTYVAERLAEIKTPPVQKVTPAPVKAPGIRARKDARSRKGRRLSVAVRRFEAARAALAAVLDEVGLTPELLVDLRKLQGFADVAEKFNGRAP